MRTRKTGPDDIPALKALWKQAFGDTDAEIDSFFKTVYPEATGFCAEEDGAVIAMLFALPVTLAHGEETQKAAYLYAVATDEAFRGRGVCRSLMEFAEKTLRKRYVSCLLLVPETEKLAAYYETMGYVRQDSCTMQTLRIDAPQGAAAVVTPQEYAGLRETLLFDVPHTRYSKAQLDYAAEDLDFYRLEQGYFAGASLPAALWDREWLLWLGLPCRRLLSADYFPLLPWGGLFWAGCGLGQWLFTPPHIDRLRQSRSPGMARLGRHTLALYLCHQPVWFMGLWLLRAVHG